MTRLVLLVAAGVAGLSGCATQARYVERTADSGVIAIPENTDTFPSFSRSEALSLIEKHVGPNYDIVEERPVATQVPNRRNLQAETEFVRSPNRITPSTATDPRTPVAEGTHEVTEWRIAYRKRTGSWLSDGGLTTSAAALTPAAGEVQQTQYQSGAVHASVVNAGGIVPSVAPGGGVVTADGTGTPR
ncbi:hypothetical protein [Gemmata sp.]|uniref:hypothetical protein n=1 Tax=Gemmata sp. TaxID=1914242 RepID=UPI003F70DD56